jgi:hypothetical protein
MFILFTGFYQPGNFYWASLAGEKHRFVSPLSESPLGQPLVPGSDHYRGLTMRLSFLVEGEKERGDEWTVTYRY